MKNLKSIERRRLAARLLLAGISLLVSIVIAEVALNFCLDLPASRVEIGDAYIPNLNARLRNCEYDTEIVTNRAGLRHSRDVPVDHEGTFRIVVVGDSMTFGVGVNNDETYCHVAETLLREKYHYQNVEIVNISRPAAGPCLYLEFVRTFAKRLKPDMLIVGFYVGNDMQVANPFIPQEEKILQQILDKDSSSQSVLAAGYQRLVLPRLMARFMRKAQREVATGGYQKIPGENCPVTGFPNALGTFLISTKLTPQQQKRYDDLKSKGWVDKALRNEICPFFVIGATCSPHARMDHMWLRKETQAQQLEEWQLCRRVLTETVKESRDVANKTLLLVIPDPYQLDSRCLEVIQDMGMETHPDMLKNRVRNDRVLEFSRESNVDVLDLYDPIRERVQEGDDLFFPIDTHLTRDGHALAGNILAKYLSQVLSQEQYLANSRLANRPVNMSR